MAGRDLRRRGWLPSLGVAALVALTILDVVLVKLAFDHTEAAAPSGRGPVATPSERVDAGGGGGAAEQPTEAGTDGGTDAEGAAAAVVPEGPVHLALAADGNVLRATAGACDDGDGGEGVRAQVRVARSRADGFREVPVAPDLAAVLTVRATSEDDLLLVAADADCDVSAYRGGVGRDTWAAGPARDEWYLDRRRDPAVVHAPGGTVQVPCTPVALSTLDAVRVLCDGGALVGTGDGGETWVALGRLEEAAAVAFAGPSRGIALARRADCPVTVLTTVNGGAGWDPVGCLDGETGRAVAVRGDEAVAVVDDLLWRSTDGGETWQRAGG